MTGTTATNKFTESLLSLIRQQRHYGARIIISTQEPTISAKLLDLCNICIVHRFASPEWLSILQRHIGALRCEIGADGGGNGTGFNDMMKIIMNLMEGEALIFAPSAIMADGEFESEEHSGVWTTSQSSETSIRRLRKLGMGILKVKIRKRITHDGGKSKLAVTNT